MQWIIIRKDNGGWIESFPASTEADVLDVLKKKFWERTLLVYEFDGGEIGQYTGFEPEGLLPNKMQNYAYFLVPFGSTPWMIADLWNDADTHVCIPASTFIKKIKIKARTIEAEIDLSDVAD